LKQNLKKYYEKFQQHSNKIQKELDAVDAPQEDYDEGENFAEKLKGKSTLLEQF
jgi:hypothetical protein